MKRSELDRTINQAVRHEAKQRGWKSISGIAYWTIGPLFFQLLPSGNPKACTFHFSMLCKWLALDSELWRVLDMRGNERAPFSLHANGAFVLRGWEVLSGVEHDVRWEDEAAPGLVAAAATVCEHRAHQVAAQITDLDGYLAFIRDLLAALLERHPGAAVSTHIEELLAALARGRMDEVERIARERIAARDHGGFYSNYRTFYENALWLCQHGG